MFLSNSYGMVLPASTPIFLHHQEFSPCTSDDHSEDLMVVQLCVS